MGVQIGRAGAAGELVVSSWEQSGPDGVRVSGWIREASTLAATKAVRDQVAGLGSNVDEPVVPVIYDEDSSQDGFYRVGSVSVGSEPRQRLDANSVFQFQVDLERVAGYQAPLFEVLRRGAIRTNSLSVTNGVATTGLPGGHKVPRWSTVTDGQVNYVTADGSVSVYAGSGYENDATFYLEPDGYYGGSACVQVSEDQGTTWGTLIGRQSPNLPTWARVGNGRVRATLSELSGALVITTSLYDPNNGDGTWEDVAFNMVDKSVTAPIFASYTDSKVAGPVNVVAGPDGNVWFTAGESFRVGKVTPAGDITAYWVGGGNIPRGICVGPDNLIWFTTQDDGSVRSTTTSGSMTEYNPANTSFPAEIVAGPDDRLWFTSFGNSRINAMTTNGTASSYTDASIDGPLGITSGPDNRLWFTNFSGDSIGAIATNGTVTDYTDASISEPATITTGPDNRLWFTNRAGDSIGAITTNGTVTEYTDAAISTPRGIVTGPNDNLWFTNEGNNTVGYCDTNGSVTGYSDSSLNDPWGITLGDDNNLWVASRGNDRIVTIDPSPVFDPDPIFLLEMGGTLTVNRNSPEVASIKVGSAGQSDALDLTVRRGANYIEGYATSDTNRGFGVFRTESEAASIVTGGVQATAKNADSNQFIVLSPSSVTADTNGTSGISLASEASEFSFGVAPASDDTATDLATITEAYFAAVAHRQISTAR